MSVQENHRNASHSSGGTTGDSMSPTTWITPFRHPRMFRGGVSGGTSLATGLPFLVMTTGSRVFCTSSITFKQRALNCPAAIVFMTTPCDHGHGRPHTGQLGASSHQPAATNYQPPATSYQLPFILRAYGGD